MDTPTSDARYHQADQQLEVIARVLTRLYSAYQQAPSLHTVAPYMSLIGQWLQMERVRLERMREYGDSVQGNDPPL